MSTPKTPDEAVGGAIWINDRRVTWGCQAGHTFEFPESGFTIFLSYGGGLLAESGPVCPICLMAKLTEAFPAARVPEATS